jgi:hypothetical protein
MFTQPRPAVSRADLIDLLLDADELARRLLICRALQADTLLSDS